MTNMVFFPLGEGDVSDAEFEKRCAGKGMLVHMVSPRRAALRDAHGRRPRGRGARRRDCSRGNPGVTGFLSHEEVEALAAHALDAALRGGASGADVLYSEGCANGLTLKDGEIEESTSGSSAGLGVRTILADGRQGIAYGNRLDRGSVDSLIEWSLHNARASQPEEGVMLYDGPPRPLPRARGRGRKNTRDNAEAAHGILRADD